MSDVIHYRPLTLCMAGPIDWRAAGWTSSEHLVTCPNCLAALQPWQPIETVPKVAEEVVILADAHYYASAWWAGEAKVWIPLSIVEFADGCPVQESDEALVWAGFKPTHWRRPLTPPPAAKDKS